MKPQWQIVLALLESGPKTTADFIKGPYGLAAEYRRAISELRKKGYNIPAPRHISGGNWEYELVTEKQMRLAI